MKITTKLLKRIIKEELTKLKEVGNYMDTMNPAQAPKTSGVGDGKAMVLFMRAYNLAKEEPMVAEKGYARMPTEREALKIGYKLLDRYEPEKTAHLDKWALLDHYETAYDEEVQ